MDKTSEMLELIRCYIEKAHYLCGLLRRVIPDERTFLASKVSPTIPREGYIGQVYYKFHGVGCYFKYEDGEIDIDFGPNDKCDGFDLYRLRDFLGGMEDKGQYIGLINKDFFNRQFSDLVARNVIYNPNLEPSTHLYYLKMDTEIA